MKYILDDRYSYSGYKKLPFGIYDNLSGETFFFDRDKYSLLLDCDNNLAQNIANSIKILFKDTKRRQSMHEAALSRSKLFDKGIYAKNFFRIISNRNN